MMLTRSKTLSLLRTRAETQSQRNLRHWDLTFLFFKLTLNLRKLSSQALTSRSSKPRKLSARERRQRKRKRESKRRRGRSRRRKSNWSFSRIRASTLTNSLTL